MGTLTGKCAVVTGGGSGIGLAVARLFLEAGATVTIVGRDDEKLRRAAEGLHGGDRLLFRAVDVTDAAAVNALFRDASAPPGRVDILVNNAGANIKARTFEELTPESWNYLLGANLHGAFYCSRAVLPQMRERKDGLIINVNSISGKRSNPLGGVGYNAAKFGLRGMAMGMAAEERVHGIRVTSIYPGEVDTPILVNRPKPLSEDHLRTILQPDDVAQAALFVALLPARAAVPELVILPSNAQYV
jgi:NAD(P)-dependent dehydrogenase (short-subunit alcohol dehydrogenase family)